MSSPYPLLATFTAQPDKIDALKVVLESAVAPSLAESSCLHYALHQQIDEPSRFTFYEIWESQAAHEIHVKTVHCQTLLSHSAPLLAEPITVVPLRKIG